uniref:Carbohydrate kinase PfkB domain-containing protein n=1 Tax=Chlamydomonas leiostraca TaxID=1034604 RepID=A0A7S0RQS8_9CHLO|mmetsp:Transcript_28839/g.73557  ORF Transcript_28839/g.73557 Transcript_28839/m.73557 type:complete len:456 (+) Transcript_28839:61-1428(+)
MPQAKSRGMPDKQQETAPELVCFTVIVDDLVFPDGGTAMAQLGGGGPQTLFGYQLAAHALRGGVMACTGLAAGVGPDLPPSCVEWLHSIGVDTRGLVPHVRPTPRAWQVFEEDGRRTQVWRGAGDPCDELYSMLRPRIDNLPPHFLRAPTYHIGIHPLHPPLKLLRALREAAHAHGGLLSSEPYTAAERPASWEEVQALLRVVDVFSPNESEAASMVGPGSPLQMAHRLLEAAGPEGARVVVVRCGPAGVVAAWRGEDGTLSKGWQVPAVPDTKVADVCGAGNSFCGGFLASLAASRTADRSSSLSNASGATVAGHAYSPEALRDACVWGCVSASFMVEERGVPHTPLQALWPRAQQRAGSLRGKALRVSASASLSRTGCMQAHPGRALPAVAAGIAQRRAGGMAPRIKSSCTPVAARRLPGQLHPAALCRAGARVAVSARPGQARAGGHRVSLR